MQEQLNESTLELLGFLRPRCESSSSAADVFLAEQSNGLEDQEIQFVYLKSRTTKSELPNISIKAGVPTHFVGPASSPLSESDINSAFKGGPYKYFRLQDLLWNRVSRAFAPYSEALKLGIVVEPNFVQPRTEDANSTPDREVKEFLASRSSKYGAGTVLTLRAPAAVGKTTLCRVVVEKLLEGMATFKCVPVFIESSHWSQLRLESVSDLWEVVRNSLLSIAPDITVGKSTFEAALKAGAIVFIFDGLDELCGRRDATFSAEDLIDELATLAQGSNARIVVTTRTAYWDSEIKKTWSNVSKLDLAPFNKQQAVQYFERRFKSDMALRRKAKDLYEKIIQASNLPTTPGGSRAQFVNLPACVALVADLIMRDADAKLDISNPQHLAEEMLLSLCDRDRQRKSLQTSGATQLSAFAQLAASNTSGEANYQLSLLTATGFNALDIDRITDHPLIRLSRPGEFEFTYEFLDPYFKAYFLSTYIRNPSSVVVDDAHALMAANGNGKSSVLEHLSGLCSDLSPMQVTQLSKDVHWGTHVAAKSFLLHFGLLLCDQNKASHKERAAFLSEFSGNLEFHIENLLFIGSFSRLDLRGYVLSHCTFQDSTLTDISVDAATSLNHCRFEGEIVLDGRSRDSDWMHITTTGNTADSRASIVCGFLLDDKESKNREILLDAFNVAIQKFWHNGTPRRSINQNNWKRGLLGASPWCDLILESFLKTGLVREIEISGTESGGYAIERSIFPDVQRFIDSRSVSSGKIAEAFNYCLERI